MKTPSNLYLKSGTVINVTGSLAGSSIGLSCEDGFVTFTNGYATYNAGTAPATLFSPDISATEQVSADADGEACLTLGEGCITYVERAWDGKKVTSRTNFLTSNDYTLLTNVSGNEALRDGVYVVKDDVTVDEDLYVYAENCKLILCDGATLTAKSIILYSQNYLSPLPNGARLSIYGQAGGTGHLVAVGSNYPAIASLGLNDKNNDVLNIHGGFIEATSPDFCAGIGTNDCGELNLDNHYFGAINIYGGTVTARGGSGSAGIGSGSSNACNQNYGVINIYGGDVTAVGGEGGAGIGGGCNSRNEGDVDAVNIYGGRVTATGGTDAAGIGSGNRGDQIPNPGTITICGGMVRAYGTGKGAGIGGGVESSGYKTFIRGGHVEANGGDGNAAGIGGGKDANGGIIEISGGEVFAYGGDDGGAGIGGGKGGSGGTVTISDGSVFAYGAKKAAGIGGGENGAGAAVSITGGSIIAQAGTQEAEQGYRAIGAGKGSDSNGSISFANNIGVRYGTGIDQYYSIYSYRGVACRNYPFAKIEPCSHAGAVIAITDGSSHQVNCQLCRVTSEVHDFNNLGECTICHLICLTDNSDNGDIISHWNDETGKSVTLSGRRLWKDGVWNTLCLPFDASLTGDLAGATLMELDTDAGSYAHITGFDEATGTLYLNFKSATSIEAGTPYIIKWGTPESHPSSNLTDPTFSNVTIKNTRTEVESADHTLVFAGAFSPLIIGLENKSLLFLGGNNTLYYPQPADAEHPITIGSCRAHFRLKGIEASPIPSQGGVKEFVLNFDGSDDATSMYDEQCTMYDGSLTPSLSEGEGAIYNLAGQRLSKMQRGINIVNGEKILVGPHGHSVK